MIKKETVKRMKHRNIVRERGTGKEGQPEKETRMRK